MESREDVYTEFLKHVTSRIAAICNKIKSDYMFGIRILEIPNILDVSDKTFSIAIIHKPTTNYLDVRFKVSEVNADWSVLDTIYNKLKSFYDKWAIHINTSTINSTTFTMSPECLVHIGDTDIPVEILAKFSKIINNVNAELDSRGDFTINIPKFVDILIQLGIVSPKES